MGRYDKQWAHKYILDPLTAPEPNQEDGPGTSFFNPKRASYTPPEPAEKQPIHLRRKHPVDSLADSLHDILTPPSSVSPVRSFHPSNPFSDSPSSPLEPHEESSPPRRISPGPASLPPASPRSPAHRRYPPITTTGRGHIPGHQRSYSADAARNFRPRYPGDMSHRPLDMIKRENRAADRLGRPRRTSDIDTIDALDTIGGTYHHGGPFDATLASRNLNKKYSPVAAVQESNMAAIRATPREFIQDSLRHHVPMQGIATIPSGETDMSGKVMRYDEGADLMREADAAGGAYKRWDGLNYHPDDLKGKSEPSYTYERDQKAKAKAGEYYEMQSGVNGDGVLGPAVSYRPRRHHSVSDKGRTSATTYTVGEASGLQRSNTTGKKLSDGIKRRFGSLRRKKSPEEA